jgi:anti-sigma-K factor RskA
VNENEPRNLIFLYVTGDLEEVQAKQVRSLLASGNPVYQGYYAEAQATAANLCLAVKPLDPPASAKQTLFARLGSTTESVTPPPSLQLVGSPQTQPVSGFRFRTVLLGSALAAVLAAFMTWSAALYGPIQRQQRETDQLKSDLALSNQHARQLELDHRQFIESTQLEIAAKNADISILQSGLEQTNIQIKDLQTNLASKDQQISQALARIQSDQQRLASSEQALTSARKQLVSSNQELAVTQARNQQLEQNIQAYTRAVRARNLIVASLGGSPSQPDAWARLLWDQDTQVWEFHAFNLQQPPEGKTYELWFIASDQTKTAAAIFNVNADGEAHITVSVPQHIGNIAMAAVTDEPVGGVTQPTGSIQLAGPLQ